MLSAPLARHQLNATKWSKKNLKKHYSGLHFQCVKPKGTTSEKHSPKHPWVCRQDFSSCLHGRCHAFHDSAAEAVTRPKQSTVKLRRIVAKTSQSTTRDSLPSDEKNVAPFLFVPLSVPGTQYFLGGGCKISRSFLRSQRKGIPTLTLDVPLSSSACATELAQTCLVLCTCKASIELANDHPDTLSGDCAVISDITRPIVLGNFRGNLGFDHQIWKTWNLSIFGVYGQTSCSACGRRTARKLSGDSCER